jgi:hypothetical protein
VFGKLSLRQQALDVVQLHKCLLEGVLKISEEAIRNQENVSYCREAAEALAQVRSGKVQAGVPDESGTHGAGSRHRLCRRSAAPEVHRLLPQVAQRAHDLCAGVKYQYSVPSTQFSEETWVLDTEYRVLGTAGQRHASVRGAVSADEKHISVYSPVAIYTLPVLERAGREYVGLLELLEPLGRVSSRTNGIALDTPV